MGAQTIAPEEAADLFGNAKVWSVHLRLAPEQWAAMEPKQTGGPRPFGPGGREAGPGRFRPADLFAQQFMKGDNEGDGKLSKAEFRTLGEGWFSAWTDGKGNELSGEQMSSGAASLAPQPPFGRGRGSGPGLTGPAGGRNGMSAMAGINFEYVHADLEFEGREFRHVAVRYKGNNTFMMARNSIKRSLKIDLNKYVKGQRLAGQETLNLHNNITDPSFLNEVLSYQLFRDAGVPSPRTAYARVFITVPGKYEHKYFGLYSVVENIDDQFAADRFGSDEGAIYKPVTRELFSHLGDDWDAYKQTYDPRTKLTKAQKARVIDFARFVTSAPDADFANHVGDFVDLDEFARFMAVTVWLSNQDSILGMGQNFYVYLNAKTNRFEFLPWDLDHSFGQFPMAGGEAETLNINHPWQGRNRFLERMFSAPAFRKLYLSKLAEFNTSIFATARITREADRITAAIRPAVAEASATLLSRFEAAAAGRTVPSSGGPGGFMRPGKPVRAFVPARAQSVADQLAGKQSSEQEVSRVGGRGGLNPANMLFASFDANKDSRVTHDEFSRAIEIWFTSWNTDGDEHLTAEELRNGLDKAMPRPPMPAGPPPQF